MKELKVQPIRNGTVIDHVAAGQGLRVLRILKIPREGSTSTVTAAMNVTSERHAEGRKDVLKIEDRELDEDELSKIALLAPNATINIVREYNVTRKDQVALPDKVTGIVKCPNPNCITNHEAEKSQFRVLSKDPVRLQCAFCDRDVVNVAEHIRSR